ncbi:hypothetical protein PVL29_006928 [Vitis rotundifolia]|uniref:Uncharacterized protein n=1 Tax=Vitis rotundifolia TaxID=103349 RepID=A0AA39A768_VITRO|nr:hypothetical protein PVL29_006928 [Vitis rotundifolia]
MFQFSKRLASKGLKVTLLITTTCISKSMHAQDSSIDIEIICEGFDQRKAESIEDSLERYRIAASQSLAELIEQHSRSNHPAKILVYDSILPWAQDVAERQGLHGASFFTQSCAVSAIYYHFNQRAFSSPLEGSVVALPSMPLFHVNDLPSFISDKGSDSALLNLLLNQFSNFQKVKRILFNTYTKLEDETKGWSMTDYGLSLFKQNIDTCITWLDTKEIGSVVYVSFGSVASLGEEQMEELAWGLKRKLEEKKFPNKFVEETSGKGLVVSWCPQLEVLAHKAVGCFLTRLPMVAMPQFSDQRTNAKFIEDVWRVGVRVKVDEKGIVKSQEIEMWIKEIMEGELGNEMKRNAERWKELAKEAVNEGGSSDKNIEEFVAEILCS